MNKSFLVCLRACTGEARTRLVMEGIRSTSAGRRPLMTPRSTVKYPTALHATTARNRSTSSVWSRTGTSPSTNAVGTDASWCDMRGCCGRCCAASGEVASVSTADVPGNLGWSPSELQARRAWRPLLVKLFHLDISTFPCLQLCAS